MELFGKNKKSDVGTMANLSANLADRSCQTWESHSEEVVRKNFYGDFQAQVLELLMARMLPDDVALTRAKVALRNFMTVSFESKKSFEDIRQGQNDLVQRMLGAQACMLDPIPMDHSTPARKILKAKRRLRSRSESSISPEDKKQKCLIM